MAFRFAIPIGDGFWVPASHLCIVTREHLARIAACFTVHPCAFMKSLSSLLSMVRKIRLYLPIHKFALTISVSCATFLKRRTIH